MAPIFLCACGRIIREQGANKRSGSDRSKGTTAVAGRAKVGRAKVGRAKMRRAKLRVAERAHIGSCQRIEAAGGIVAIGTKRRVQTGVGILCLIMRLTGPGRSRGAVGVGDRSLRNVWESLAGTRLSEGQCHDLLKGYHRRRWWLPQSWLVHCLINSATEFCGFRDRIWRISDSTELNCKREKKKQVQYIHTYIITYIHTYFKKRVQKHTHTYIQVIR